MQVLIIRAQPFFHSPASIVGNIEGLTALRDLLNKAIENALSPDVDRHTGGLFTPPDGESYEVDVFVNDRYWQDESWQNEPDWYYRTPYYIDDITTGFSPDEIIKLGSK